MEATKEEIQEMIREALSEMNESDLITKKGNKSWNDHKSEFKENIDTLLQHIEDDKYSDAEGVIGQTIKTLQDWKQRIKDGLSNSKGEVIDEN